LSNIHLRPLHTSILGIYKVFEQLVCCLKGMWVHPYTVTPAKLTPDLGTHGHLRSGNDVITSCLRLMSISDHFIHPYLTYKKGLSNCYAVSRAYGCTHTVTPAKLAPDLGSKGHLRSWNDTTMSWMRLIVISPFTNYRKYTCTYDSW